MIRATNSFPRTRSAPRIRLRAAGGWTAMRSLNALVSGLYVVGGRRWATTIRGGDARSSGAVLWMPPAVQQDLAAMGLVTLRALDRGKREGLPYPLATGWCGAVAWMISPCYESAVAVAAGYPQRRSAWSRAAGVDGAGRTAGELVRLPQELDRRPAGAATEEAVRATFGGSLPRTVSPAGVGSTSTVAAGPHRRGSQGVGLSALGGTRIGATMESLRSNAPS